MSDQLTAKFDTLSQAEEAAARLRSIRIEEIGISSWQGAQSERDAEMNENLHGPFGSIGGSAYFPMMGGGVSSGGLGMLPLGAVELYSPDIPQQGYLLNAVIGDEQLDMAVRIIRECGGKEI